MTTVIRLKNIFYYIKYYYQKILKRLFLGSDEIDIVHYFYF